MDYINWFPGHMSKALREIKEKQAVVDCFIVVLDARVPLSSYNEDLDLIAPSKPRLFVFSKADYSDSSKLNKILPKFNNNEDRCIVVNLKNNSSRQKILSNLNKLLEKKRIKDKEKGLLKPRLRCFVLGMPNVGKSTLINLLSNSQKVKVANFAGTTRSLQWISANDIQLLDTPGLLMPKITNQDVALKLLACSLIKQEVMSDLEFYYRIVDILNFVDKSRFEELGINYSSTEEGKYGELVKYARNHRLVLSNNEPDVKKVAMLIRKKIVNLKNILWD